VNKKCKKGITEAKELQSTQEAPSNYCCQRGGSAEGYADENGSAENQHVEKKKDIA